MADLAEAVGAKMSVRSALIGPREIKPALEKRELDPEAAASWAEAVMALFQTGKERAPSEGTASKKSKGKGKKSAEVAEDLEESAEDGEAEAIKGTPAGRQVLTLGRAEIDALTEVAAALHKANISVSEMRGLVENPTKRRSQPQNVQDTLAALDAIRTNAGLDGALFGRMATGIALSRVDSAVHVGHALTTHAFSQVLISFRLRISCSIATLARLAARILVHVNWRRASSICPLLLTSRKCRRIFPPGTMLKSRRSSAGWLRVWRP
jgi:hypothetical protein